MVASWSYRVATGTSTGSGCDDLPAVGLLGDTSVAPLIAPSRASASAGATVVSLSAQLSAALAWIECEYIVLADGTYDASGPFSSMNGSHLYAEHLGGGLTAGLVIGGNFGSGGGSVQGVAFNVSSASKTFNGGEVYVWGKSARTQRGPGQHLQRQQLGPGRPPRAGSGGL